MIRSWKDNPVDQKELERFWKRVQKMADEEFGTDDEEDSTIEVRLVDRTHFERDHFEPYLYPRHCKTKEEWERLISIAMMNLSIAFNRLDTLHKMMRDVEMGQSRGNEGR